MLEISLIKTSQRRQIRFLVGHCQVPHCDLNESDTLNQWMILFWLLDIKRSPDQKLTSMQVSPDEACSLYDVQHQQLICLFRCMKHKTKIGNYGPTHYIMVHSRFMIMQTIIKQKVSLKSPCKEQKKSK